MKERNRSRQETFFAAFTALGAAFLLMFSFTAIEAFSADVSFSNLSLTADGDASWEASVDDSSYEIEKFQIRLAREKNGTWDYSYKTYTTSEDSYDISFSSTGRYYFVVRAKLYGGSYGEWSEETSNIVTVTSDDVSHYSPSPGSGGTAYFGPIYSNTSGTIGPGSSSSGTSAQTSSGWILDSKGYRYYYANGTYMSGGWDFIDDYWYYFDTNGYMQVGWLYYGDHWYYLYPGSGRMAYSSWNNINEKWYYFNESGIMQTGYIVIDGETFYTDSSGARVQNTYNPDGHYFDMNGVMVS